jgi:LPPG:FO 2-phospho-L-lactate transferase
MIVVLTGGTGGAKLIEGLSRETNPENLFIVCNTADDFAFRGLHVSPDLDTITYTLAGIGDTERGWGVKGDTFAALDWLGKYGAETWFQIGDRDLATHVTRTHLLREGRTLSEATERIRKALGVTATITPMSDDRVETRIKTPTGELSFQEYFVRERWAPDVLGVTFVEADSSRPAPGILDAIHNASTVIVCPSNPVTSIGPILAVAGIRDALVETKAPVLAVSPIIGEAPVSGPAHKLMRAMGMEVSAFGVAKSYSDFLATIVIDHRDGNLKEKIENLGIKASVTAIRMDSLDDKRHLAREVLGMVKRSAKD